MNTVNKTICIFDLDNTLVNSFDIWSEITFEALQSYSDVRNIPLHQVDSRVKQAHMSVRFGDIDGMIKWLDDHFFPRHMSRPMREQEAFKQATDAIADKWHRGQEDLCVFYEGALETLIALKEKGVTLVIQTNAEQDKLERRFYCMAENALKMHPDKIKSTFDVIDLFDGFYARPNHDPKYGLSEGKKTNREKFFVERLRQNLQVFDKDKSKPLSVGTGEILERFDKNPAEALFFGDSQDDGLAAKGFKIDFAYAAYGTVLSDVTYALDERLGDPSFPIGTEQVAASFKKHDIKPAITLSCYLSHILNEPLFTFGEKTSKAPRP